jgi:hypothetical protein
MKPDVHEQNEHGIEVWACDKAQEIMLREGFRLIRSARSGNNTDIREDSLMMARVIAASLMEASVVTRMSRPAE